MCVCVCVWNGGVLLKQGCQHLKNQSPSGLISYKGRREGRKTHKHTHRHTHSYFVHLSFHAKTTEGKTVRRLRAPLVSCLSDLSEHLTPRPDPAAIKAGAIFSSGPHLRLAIFKSEVAAAEAIARRRKAGAGKGAASPGHSPSH